MRPTTTEFDIDDNGAEIIYVADRIYVGVAHEGALLIIEKSTGAWKCQDTTLTTSFDAEGIAEFADLVGAIADWTSVG